MSGGCTLIERAFLCTQLIVIAKVWNRGQSYEWKATLLFAVWFEPTDVTHIWKLSETDIWKRLTYISPNFAELQQMVAGMEAKITSAHSLS